MHIAVVVEDAVATLYVDGSIADARNLVLPYPALTEGFKIGGDNRLGNTQYFKGTLYSVSLFDHSRTPEQIQQDTLFVDANTEGLLYTAAFTTEDSQELPTQTGGATFTNSSSIRLDQTLSSVPHTVEAVVHVPNNYKERAGVIVGNYCTDGTEVLNLEIFEGGRVRLYYRSNGQAADCIFPTDIRSDVPVHIAVTVLDTVATLYVNGTAKEIMVLDLAYPTAATENFRIGGDNRLTNNQYFKGSIYSVNLFSEARTAEQIQQDMVQVGTDTQGLLYSRYFLDAICSANDTDGEHIESDWLTDRALSSENGIMHTECTLCGKLLQARQISTSDEGGYKTDYTNAAGLKAEDVRLPIEQPLAVMPLTYELTVLLPKTYQGRGGVLFGNYNGGTGNFVNIEIYTDGQPRLWYKIGATSYFHLFQTDVRSAKPTHIALTVEGLTANLYVNGTLVETATLRTAIPTTLANYYIGSDSRTTNMQPFQGTIYGVSLFDHVRTAEQIAVDAVLVSPNEPGLILSKYFLEEDAK